MTDEVSKNDFFFLKSKSISDITTELQLSCIETATNEIKGGTAY